MIRAIVFDLDGTLVDSLEDIVLALDAALEDHGLAPPGIATVRTWIGGGARILVEQAMANDPGAVDAVLARFRAHYTARPVVHTQIYPGLAAVLDRCVVANIALAVLSNKPHALTLQIANDLLAPWPFAKILGGRDGVPLKPNPQSALEIARELGVPPDACAFVGDSAIDVETAHAAGMLAVAVTWGFRPRAELVAARPALIVDAPAELLMLAT